MKIMVTGASGFLGKGMVDRLLLEGHSLVTLTSKSIDNYRNSDVKEVLADLTDINQVVDCYNLNKDIDVIIHLAAFVPKNKSEDQIMKMYDVNVNGLINLLTCFGPNLKKFVYASTAEVYGLPQVTGLIDENELPSPVSYYGSSKLAGEHICNVYSLMNKLPITIMRFTVMYGPGDKINRALPNFIKTALKGDDLKLFGGEEKRDYLYIDDAVEALYKACANNVSGTFNIATGKGVSVALAADSVVSLVNSSSKINKLPREKKASDIVLDVSLAESVLGFKARYSFPEMLETQIEWHKQHE